MHVRLSTSLLATLLVTGLGAQTQGTYQTFGAGCRGSGGSGAGCVSQNWNQPLRTTTGVSANFAVLANTGRLPRVICGFEFFCFTLQSQPVTMKVWIYDRPTPTSPPTKILRSSTMTVGRTAGAYRATITPPLVLKANTEFFLVFDNRAGRLRLPISAAGPVIGTHYFNGPPSWRGPFKSSLKWNYNILCCGQGGAIPTLSNTGVPAINKTFSLDLAKAKANTGTALVFGGSKTQWAAFKLPLDLTAAGAAGCSLLASIDLIIGVATNGSGAGTVKLALPNDRRLIGVQFHNQWIVIDGVNQLGLVFTNGGTGKIGS